MISDKLVKGVLAPVSANAPLISQNGLRVAVLVLLSLEGGAPIDLLVPGVGFGLVDMMFWFLKDVTSVQ